MEINFEKLKSSEAELQWVSKGARLLWQVKGSAIAEGEAAPHERSRRLSGQNTLRLKKN